MANTDDLEEYDAELELSLKREYATVFPLFRYCVVTQEATYLCNKLEMDCAPQAGYLLFEIAMEDVWVWDRNRPTRIIPRAQVYTTSDVTVEQLKDDDEADLDAAIPASVIEQLRGMAAADGEGDEDDDGADEGEESPDIDVRRRDLPDDAGAGTGGGSDLPSWE
jgi:Protein of unknown function (DUF2469)